MTETLTWVVLVVVLQAVAINLLLTLRIAQRLQDQRRLAGEAEGLQSGVPLPAFSARRLIDDKPVTEGCLIGQANVLVFLSSSCADCKSKLPQLIGLRDAMRAHDIQLLVISNEPAKKYRQFIGSPALLECVIEADSEDYRSLNPRNATPSYIFVDHEGIVRASDFIGDENWQAFIKQMTQLGEAEAAE